MDYALISNGVVTNVIRLSPNNAYEFPNAVKLNDIPAGIGDTYNAEEDRFYHNGEPIYSLQEQPEATNYTEVLDILTGEKA